jgi:hypothetical protein
MRILVRDFYENPFIDIKFYKQLNTAQDLVEEVEDAADTLGYHTTTATDDYGCGMLILTEKGNTNPDDVHVRELKQLVSQLAKDYIL